MSDRLNELRRQRALVQQHLDWLDDEIASASGASAPTTPRPLSPPPSGYLASQAAAIARSAPVPTASVSAPSDDNPVVSATADAILAEYRVAPDSLKTDIRKGCLLYFFGALVLVAAGVTALYFLLSKR